MSFFGENQTALPGLVFLYGQGFVYNPPSIQPLIPRPLADHQSKSEIANLRCGLHRNPIMYWSAWFQGAVPRPALGLHRKCAGNGVSDFGADPHFIIKIEGPKGKIAALTVVCNGQRSLQRQISGNAYTKSRVAATPETPISDDVDHAV